VPACPLLSAALDAALPAVRAFAAQLPAGAEVDLQAGAEGVHVNVAQVDARGAAIARRELDRLTGAAAGGVCTGNRRRFGRRHRRCFNRRQAGRGAGRGRCRRARRRAPAGAGRWLSPRSGAPANRLLVERVLEAVGPAPGVVLELYAGSGNFTRALVGRAAPARLFACEGDPAAVARGRRAAPGAEWSGRLPDISGRRRRCSTPPREGATPPTRGGDAARAAGRLPLVRSADAGARRPPHRPAPVFASRRALAIDLMPQTFPRRGSGDLRPHRAQQA